MKKILLCITIAALSLLSSCGKKYTYESVPNDPLNTRIYTLDNGLKVYLSVNKDKPRIQTYIGVKVGGKNDPAETTGLAHYFEHLMFKGTTKFGTSNYELEEPMLDEIEQLYEVYRYTTDDEERKNIYTRIDSISQEASKIAIPNEYDKLMTAIGSQGTNAFTSYDVTAYVENIPSNEIENWAMIQSERFTNPVIRLFHTELETVYEEYNMYLTYDGRKIYEAVLNGLFPHHPYGTQTVIGTQEHLKNPSISNIKKYFDTYYVPNNMAVVMVGDFNPNEAIRIIDQYFGSMEPKDVPELITEPEPAITQPIVKEVIGLEAENIAIAYRMPAANTQEAAVLELVDYLLTNGKAGLIDLNLVQQQKVLNAGSYTMMMADYGALELFGTPKEGQTLDDVKNLLLEQIELLKRGDFDEELLAAVINNFRLNEYYQQQEPGYAAQILLYSFINNVKWKDQVNKINYQSSLTKQDIVDFCNKYFKDNYVVVYKRQGKPNDKKIEKPQITPISANRDTESDFLAEIKLREVKPIEPVFLDYSKDINFLTAKQEIPVLYRQNTTNPLFSMNYVFDMGTNSDKILGIAFQYLNYLGTSEKTAEEIKSELYKLACSFNVSATQEQVYVSINGLSDNFIAALDLLEERLNDVTADIAAYQNLINDILKARTDAKLDQYANFSRLRSYAVWGKNSPATNIATEEELKSINPEELIQVIKSLKDYKHKILYYGPLTKSEFIETINAKHQTGETLKPVIAPITFKEQDTDDNKILLAHYDANQILMSMISKDIPFNKNLEPIRTMYNEYFGGGMNSIVFQEMREARGLAYSAWGGYEKPSRPDLSYYVTAFIGTQNDKTIEAIETFQDILNNMPESQKSFDLAKESILTNLRTSRILREGILWNYLYDEKFGYTEDSRIELYKNIPTMTLENVKVFQEDFIKDRNYSYCILGNVEDLDIDSLKEIGNIIMLTQEEIFGY